MQQFFEIVDKKVTNNSTTNYIFFLLKMNIHMHLEYLLVEILRTAIGTEIYRNNHTI